MRSIAGILTFWFVLSVSLRALTAHPVHPGCKMKKILELLQQELKVLNSSIELNISHLKPMSFHQLVIDHSLSAQKQNKSATCGLLFMKEGLRKIQDHLKTLIASERFEHLDKQFKNVITRLDKHITPCARHVLAECDHHKAPEFPETDFIAKSWIRRFLESSVKFLDQVNHLLGKSKNHEQH